VECGLADRKLTTDPPNLHVLVNSILGQAFLGALNFYFFYWPPRKEGLGPKILSLFLLAPPV
jgi:hypothetical protein